jgi:hypothetical protein
VRKHWVFIDCSAWNYQWLELDSIVRQFLNNESHHPAFLWLSALMPINPTIDPETLQQLVGNRRIVVETAHRHNYPHLAGMQAIGPTAQDLAYRERAFALAHAEYARRQSWAEHGLEHTLLLSAGFIPVLGELADLVVLFHPESSPVERGLAIASLGLNLLTLGWAVNYGASAQFVRRQLIPCPAPRGLARTSDWTTSRGVIRISDAHSGPSWRPYVHSHESVHRFFTPGAGIPSTQLSKVTRARQILRLRGYQNSSVLRYVEEAIAESYALYRRTGNLSKAIGIGSRFPITRGYVTLPGLLLEGGIGGTIYVGLLYGAYEFGEYLFDE